MSYNGVGREMPSSEEAEQHVLSCCLLDSITRVNTIGRCIGAGVTPDFFFYPVNKVLYERVLDLNNRCPPVSLEVLIEELRTRRLLESCGGFAYLMQVTSRVPTAAHVGYFIEKLKETYVRRMAIRSATATVEQAYAFSGGLEDFVSGIGTSAQHLIRTAEVVTSPVMPLPDFQLPPEDDEKTLLGSNRYLVRGDGAILVSTSGMGKSAILLQMATLYALGRPFFGIRCHVTEKRSGLRILIIQAEDSAGDVAEVWTSIMHGLKLTPDEIALVRSRVFVVKEKVRRGPAFIHNMQLLADRYEPDILAINPLQNFVVGDITDKKVVGDFLYDGLNAANVDERWAYFLLHHTTKPPTGQNAKGQRNWNEVMYEMAGASNLIDWARVIQILKATKVQGEFRLNLAKRGHRAGVAKKVGLEFKPTTVIPLKWASGEIEIPGRKRKLPMILWEARDVPEDQPDVEPDEEKAKKVKNREGINEVYPDEEIVSYFPSHADTQGLRYIEVAKEARIGCGIANSAFTSRMKRLKDRKLVEHLIGGTYRRTAAGDEEAKKYHQTKP